MNTEELTKVAEIIGNLGDNAVDGLTAYLGISLADSFLGYTVGVIGIVLTYKAILKIISIVRDTQADTQCLQEVRTLLKVGCGGYVTDNERSGIIFKLSTLINNNKEK